MEWISVKDELPECFVRCLIFTVDADDAPISNIAIYNGTKAGFLVVGGHKDKDVTHWQPLPEPPK